MKIEFEDKSYIEFKKNNNKILISIQVVNQNDQLRKITNTVELTEEQFKQLFNE